MPDHRTSIFKHYTKSLTITDDASCLPYPAVSLLINTLCRQENHHALLIKSSSEKYNHAIVERFIQHLSQDKTPHLLREAHCVYFDMTAFMLSTETVDDIENDFRILANEIENSHKSIIFIMDQLEPLLHHESTLPLNTLGRLLKSILTHASWRLIILTPASTYQKALEEHNYLTSLLTPIHITEPSHSDSITLLKYVQKQLESFHQVILSDDALPSAMSLASTYLAGTSSLDKAVELLDSAAALASTQEQTDHQPIVTSHHLAHIVSSWTHIPLTHLQTNTFQTSQLMEGLQKQLFGQEAAIQQIATLLQSAYLKLHQKAGPLCSFLLVGPESTGKALLAKSLAEHLFGHTHALLRVKLNTQMTSLSDLTVSYGAQDEQYCSLLQAIQQTPYALLFFENINQLTNELKTLLNHIITQGYGLDQQNRAYDFRHTIIILSTTIGANRMIQWMKTAPEKHKQMDLMQLVMNDHIHDSAHSTDQPLMSQQLTEHMLPDLLETFSTTILDAMNIVPFLPLDYLSLEKIMRHKLYDLSNRLKATFDIELQYAPEVIKFLANEALWQHKKPISLTTFLDQQLYSCVSHAVFSHLDDKHQSKRLWLQLNDNGQLLRCELSGIRERLVMD